MTLDDSTIGLLFRISADPAQAIKAVGELRGAMEVSTSGMKAAFDNVNLSTLASQKSFHGLGISLVDAEGKIKSHNQVLGELADKFKALPSEADRSKLALELFGNQAQALLPVLSQGAAGIEKLGAQAEATALHAQRMTYLKTALAGVAIAGAAAGGVLLESANKAAEFAEKVGQVAEKSGATTEQVSTLNFAAERMGVSTDAVSRSLTFLARNLGSLAEGGRGAKPVAEALSALGFSLDDVRVKTGNVSALLPDLVDHLAHMEAGSTRTNAAMTLFGRGGAEVIPVLSSLKSGFADATSQAESFGRVVHEKDVPAAATFLGSERQMEAQLNNLSLTIGKSAIPALTSLLLEVGRVDLKIKQWAIGLEATWDLVKSGGNILLALVDGLSAVALATAGQFSLAKDQAAAFKADLHGVTDEFEKARQAADRSAQADERYQAESARLAGALRNLAAGKKGEKQADDEGAGAEDHHAAARRRHTAAMQQQTNAITALRLAELPLVQIDQQLREQLVGLAPALERVTRDTQAQIATLPVWDARSRQVVLDLISMIPAYQQADQAARSWASHTEVAFQQVAESSKSLTAKVLESIDKELLAYGVSQKGLQAIYKQLLGDLAEYLAHKAEIKAAEQVAEALGSWPDAAAMAAHFAAAAAWGALGAGVSAAAGALTGSAGIGASVATVVGPATATAAPASSHALAPGYAAAIAAQTAGQPGPQTVYVNLELNGANLLGPGDLAKTVTDAVTYGVEKLGMKAVSSHTRRSGPAGR